MSPASDASDSTRLPGRPPACVIRVRLDGELLACNDAALDLFGAGDRRDVLNTDLTDRIALAQRAQWREFMARCWAEGAGCFECGLVIRSNEARAVLIQGVALTDHPDGFESLLLHLRDEPTPERRRLIEALEAHTADRQRREAHFVELQNKLEQSQLLSLQKEREYGRDVAMLKSALAAAHSAKTTALAEKRELEPLKLRLQTVTADHVRLQALVAEYEVDRTRIAADHRAAVATLEQSVAQALAEQGRLTARAEEQTREHDRIRAEHQRALVDLEASKDAALEDVRSQLVRTLAAQRSLAERVEKAEREHDLLRAEHQQALADLEAAIGVATELRRQLSEASVEQGRLAARVEEHERERNKLIADHHRALADAEAHNREMAELRAGQVRLQALVAEYELDRKRAAAGHQAAVDTLEQSLAQSLAEQNRMSARGEEQAREQDLMRAAHQRALVDLRASKDAELADLQSHLARASAEQGDLTERAEATQRELDLLRAEHHRAHERLVADHRRALADVETGTRSALDQLRSQHSEALAGQRRLATQLDEHERERDALVAAHGRALADLETARGAELAELRSQLSQAFTDQHGLATRAAEQQLELDRLRAERDAALSDVENRNRDLLAQLRSELAHTATEHTRILAERAAEQERERDRMIAEHCAAIANLQASKEAGAAELRSQLSAARAEHHRLTALLEDGDRERERMTAEHRRAIADLEASQRETVAECERVLTEIKQALLVRDASRRLDADRRLVDGIDEGPLTKADGERFASLQHGLTAAFSRVNAVLKGGSAPKEKRLEDADLVHEPFDDADDAFVHQLLEGVGATRRPAKLADAKPAAPAQAVPGIQAVTAGDDSAEAVFDAQDAAFARGLMNTHRAPQESVDQPDAEPLQELPSAQPAAPTDS